jgi:hypothetical protein
VVAQIVGATTGVLLANLMFGLPAGNVSSHARAGTGLEETLTVTRLGLTGGLLDNV